MNRDALLSAITSNTKVLIVQNTFGRIGADYSLFSQIRNHGIFIVEDCSLSIGSQNDLGAHGSFGDVSVWSLEASKSFTLGWGGVLSVNNVNHLEIIRDHYSSLKRLPLWHDSLRIFQLWISVFFVTYPPPFGSLIWYFCLGLDCFVDLLIRKVNF